MRKQVHKIVHTMFLIAIFWLLLNFSAGMMCFWYGDTDPWDYAYAFTGITQLYVLLECRFPSVLYSVPYYCISVPLFFLLLWYWLRKPTMFKAFFLLSVGPIWGLVFTSHIVVAYFSLWWFCLFFSLGLAWKIGVLVHRH